MSRAEWYFARFVASLGMPGLVGAALFALCAGAYVGMVVPAQAELQRITVQAQTLSVSQQHDLQNNVEASRPVESELDAFYGTLPRERKVVELLDKVNLTASRESLRLTQGEYKLTRDQGGRIGSYQVVLPVRGGYVQVRKFIARVLNSLPSVALNGIRFSRDTIGGTNLETRIEFTIFLGIN